METINHVLSRKEPNFHTISPSAPLTDAVQQMHSENVDHLVVIGAGDSFLGIVCDHDITGKTLLIRRSMEQLYVRDVVNNRLPMAGINDTVEKCMKLMQQHHSRYLAVFDHFTFMGIVSANDFVDEAVKSRGEIFDNEPTH